MKLIKVAFYVAMLILFSTANAESNNETHIAIVLDEESCSITESKTLRIALKQYKSTDDIFANIKLEKEFGANCKISGIVLYGFISEDVLPTLKFAMKLAQKRVRNTEIIPKIHLWLNSEGGLISEAMKIGDFISTINDLGVIVMNNGKCFSACVLILAAAPIRSGIGDVGIHRPFSYEITTEEMNYNQYLKKYEKVMEIMRDYYQKYGVSMALMNVMSTVPSDEIRIIDWKTQDEWGLGYVNVAKREFDKAKTIEVCGKEHYLLRMQWMQFLKKCATKANDSTCMELADIAIPDYKKKFDQCESKKNRLSRSIIQ